MTDIKPDTRLYTDTVEKLRAITAVIEAQRAGSAIEWRVRGATGEWTESGTRESTYNDYVLLDHRIKPKPRELWVAYNRNGSIYKTSHDPLAQEPGTTVVRFVEQPE